MSSVSDSSWGLIYILCLFFVVVEIDEEELSDADVEQNRKESEDWNYWRLSSPVDPVLTDNKDWKRLIDWFKWGGEMIITPPS